MDKRYDNYKSLIIEREAEFGDYVVSKLNIDARTLLMAVSMQTPVYVFSGAIRDFLLGYRDLRDLDMVIKNINKIEIPLSILGRCRIKKNSFGGYKIHSGNLTIDVWDLNNTWGIQKENKKGNILSLLDSAFFNFSAIVYDYRRKKFIYKEDFLKFLENKTLEVVYENNPNQGLCIINSLYYNKKYGFPIGKSLAKWIRDHYSNDIDFRMVQNRHFGRVLYSNDEIRLFYVMCLYKLMQ